MVATEKMSIQAFEDLWKKSQEEKPLQVIDVREGVEFQAEHIPGFVSAPLSSFKDSSKVVDQSQTSYLFCLSGNRAKQYGQKLTELGYSDWIVVEGGLKSWKAAGFHTVQQESSIWSLERQVRFAAGFLVFLGVLLGFLLSSHLFFLSGFVGVGLMFAAVTDTCGMGMVLARMPWNKTKGSCSIPPKQ